MKNCDCLISCKIWPLKFFRVFFEAYCKVIHGCEAKQIRKAFQLFEKSWRGSGIRGWRSNHAQEIPRLQRVHRVSQEWSLLLVLVWSIAFLKYFLAQDGQRHSIWGFLFLSLNVFKEYRSTRFVKHLAAHTVARMNLGLPEALTMHVRSTKNGQFRSGAYPHCPILIDNCPPRPPPGMELGLSQREKSV